MYNSVAPFFQLLGSPRRALWCAGGALATPEALKVRSKSRKGRTWVLKMGLSCRRDAHFQKSSKKFKFCSVNQRKVHFIAILKTSVSCRREGHFGAHGHADCSPDAPLAWPRAPEWASHAGATLFYRNVENCIQALFGTASDGVPVISGDPLGRCRQQEVRGA